MIFLLVVSAAALASAQSVPKNEICQPEKYEGKVLDLFTLQRGKFYVDFKANQAVVHSKVKNSKVTSMVDFTKKIIYTRVNGKCTGNKVSYQADFKRCYPASSRIYTSVIGPQSLKEPLQTETFEYKGVNGLRQLVTLSKKDHLPIVSGTYDDKSSKDLNAYFELKNGISDKDAFNFDISDCRVH